MFVLLLYSCLGVPYGGTKHWAIFWIQYSHPYVWLFVLCFFFFLQDISLNPTCFSKLCNLPKCSLLHFFYKVILPTLSSSGHLTTLDFTAFWIFLHILSHLYTVPSRTLFPSQMNNKNIYLPLLAGVPKRKKGIAHSSLSPARHSDLGKTLPPGSWAPTPALHVNLASHKGPRCFSF